MMKTLRIILLVALLALLAPFALLRAQGDKDPVKKLVKLETSQGDVVVYLFDRTPRHRDEFVKLAESGALDSTFFFDVNKNDVLKAGIEYPPPKKVILPGDTTTKNLTPEEIAEQYPKAVDYEISSEVRKDLFHARGMVAAGKDELRVNPEKASNPGTFLFVLGRSYEDQELDAIEQNEVSRQKQLYGQMEYFSSGAVDWVYEMSDKLQDLPKDSLDAIADQLTKGLDEAFEENVEAFKFSPAARKAYKTEGGAPRRDNNNTVFGEVISGMDVLEKIAEMEIDGYRRLKEPVKIEAEAMEMKLSEIKKKYDYSPR